MAQHWLCENKFLDDGDNEEWKGVVHIPMKHCCRCFFYVHDKYIKALVFCRIFKKIIEEKMR